MIRSWLILSAFMVVLMISIGGLTRLTDSGLSMTDWRPITGWFPPLSEAEWNIEFASYEQSPEFKKINFDFTLEDFKGIFWLEFIHRILGRITGLIIILPYLFFALTGRINKHKPYLIMCSLVIFQGILGWYMVKSGLKDNPHVSHWRLAAHLLTAITLYMVILWQIFGHSEMREKQSKLALLIHACILLTIIQIGLGAMVAGLDAGLIYNEFPMMGGSYIPEEFTFSFNMLNDAASLQFLHRSTAYILAVIVFWLSSRLYKHSWKISYSLIATISAQIFLGIITLIYQVPTNFALMHQLFAVLLLSILLYIRRFYDRI